MSPFDTAVHAAAAAIREAEVLLVGAGAGMGVDSGLPDFRGDRGFWKAYPPYEALGLTFMDAANPEHFRADPPFGWGFYGHRLGLYRATVPHDGFGILRRWAEARGLPSFVFTSNVDGQFQKAGFDPARIVEVHGSIHHLQCTEPCGIDIWDAREEVEVDLRCELCDSANVDHRRVRCPAQRQQLPEVAVSRHDDEVVGDGAVEDLFVRGGHHVQVGDVACVVAGRAKPFCDPRRQVGVDEQPHAGRATGTSRSLTAAAANSSAPQMSSRSRYG